MYLMIFDDSALPTCNDNRPTSRNKRLKFHIYHRIPGFKDYGEITLRKPCGKRRKCWSPAFSPFPTKFSIISQIIITISDRFDMLFANAFNFDQRKILSSCKELTLNV